ncbi:MAG: low-specificity L-threonine aldolase [Synergistaceae bacterium]|nr:low-specificity L-threonine aldolase [Synergistaceae bacterium]
MVFPIDLKSDTVTKPSEEMRKAMYAAEVGDDVYGEDPTVRRLEVMAAELLGKEDALYVTSGTQGNLVALLTHCGRGDGVLVGQGAHVLNSEGGGLCALGGMVPIPVKDEKGLPALADLNHVMKPKGNVHLAYPKLLCLENTHNSGGGHASTPEEIYERASWAHEQGLSVHLDGARLFNASTALGVKPAEIVRAVDSVQICLSKGLGAPMGSLICASKDFIERARYWRKKVGGGLRQAGIVAAAGIYAFEHNIDRLAEDHENARRIKEILQKGGLRTEEVRRPTNMVYFGTADERSADRLLEACKKRQVLFNKTAPDTFRLVTHLDVSREEAVQAATIITEEFNRQQ